MNQQRLNQAELSWDVLGWFSNPQVFKVKTFLASKYLRERFLFVMNCNIGSKSVLRGRDFFEQQWFYQQSRPRREEGTPCLLLTPRSKDIVQVLHRA